MIRAIIFDLFETLVSEFDSDHPPADEVAETLQLEESAFKQEYDRIRHDRYTGKFKDYPSVLRHIGREAGRPVSEVAIQDLSNRRMIAFGSLLQEAEPKIMQMLTQIKGLDFQLGLISNTEGSEVAQWATTPMASNFDVVVFSHEVGHVKPDPRIYHVACTGLDVEPSECCYVGDGGSDELVGAAYVGMTPYCAAWYLKRHTHILGSQITNERSAGFSVIEEPEDLVTLLAVQIEEKSGS